MLRICASCKKQFGQGDFDEIKYISCNLCVRRRGLAGAIALVKRMEEKDEVKKQCQEVINISALGVVNS